MSDLTPITREEALLDGADLEPITRKEQFIKRIYDKTQEVPTPITREEWFLNKAGEGGGGVTVEQLNATENGTYSEQGKAYSPVIVEVPQTTVESLNVTANGTYTAPSGKAYSPVTVNVEGFKKKSIANTPTDIASFNDGTANPMPSLEISIEPVQSGSGDPSPSNVRPISGWSGANVSVSGVNQWDEQWENGYINNYGQSAADDSSVRSKNFCACNPGLSYHFVKPSAYRIVPNIVWYDASQTFIKRTNANTEFPIATAPDNAHYFKITAYGYGTTYNHDISINYPSTDTEYHAYNGSTLSIPFKDSQDNPITVYGGTLNVTSGELRVTMANIASYNGETINEPWISSMDVYSAGATPTTGAQVVYPLTTPQTYQLTPTQVSTLLGQNNIFADCGQVLEGEYFVTL